jgi:acetyl-CoA carboxylase biotin carboxyl carrier protein
MIWLYFARKSSNIHPLSFVDFITLAPSLKPKLSTKLKNMDFKQIQELIKMINKSNIGELTVEQKDFRVTIKQKEERVTQVMSATPVQVAPVHVVAPHQTTGNQQQKPGNAADALSANTITIKSPMIGTFYRKSSPDKPNLVDVGSDITPGKVVCIIEAMKLFNEIESEVKGRIVKVLVEDASPVEYDQPLFLVEPN